MRIIPVYSHNSISEVTTLSVQCSTHMVIWNRHTHTQQCIEFHVYNTVLAVQYCYVCIASICVYACEGTQYIARQ